MDSNTRAFASGWYVEVDVSEEWNDEAILHKLKLRHYAPMPHGTTELLCLKAAELTERLLDRIKELEGLLKPLANLYRSSNIRESGDSCLWLVDGAWHGIGGNEIRHAAEYFAAISASQSKETEKPR